MGNAIQFWEPRFRKLKTSPVAAGGLFALFLIFSVFSIGCLVIALAHGINPPIGFLAETILVYYCLSAKSLKTAAMGVYQALAAEDLSVARQKVSMIVGRDVSRLDRPGIARAAVETVAENLVDGVLSPLFFAAIGGAPPCLGL